MSNLIISHPPQKKNNTPWRGWDLALATRAFVQAFVTQPSDPRPPTPAVSPPSPSSPASPPSGGPGGPFLDFLAGQPIPLTAFGIWDRPGNPDPHPPLPPLGGRGGRGGGHKEVQP